MYLPDEILESILSQLPSRKLLTLQRVSRHWQHVILQTPSLQRSLHLGSYLSNHYDRLNTTSPSVDIFYNELSSLAVPWFHWHLDQDRIFITFPTRSALSLQAFEHHVCSHPIRQSHMSTPQSSCTSLAKSRTAPGTCTSQACWCVQQITCPPTRAVRFYGKVWSLHSAGDDQIIKTQYIVHRQGITIGLLARYVLEIFHCWFQPGRSESFKPFYDRIFRCTCWFIQKPSTVKQEREWFELSESFIEHGQSLPG